MKARILSGIVLVAGVLALLLWAPAPWTLAVIAVAILAGAWEWSAFLGPSGRPGGRLERFLFVAVIAVVLVVGWIATRDPAVLLGVLWVAAAWWVVALLWILRGPAAVNRFAAWTSGILVLVPAGLGLARLRVDLVDGAHWTLYLLVLVWAADTGAYFAGKALGRHHLAPHVSPGKTWEGVAGGLALAGAFALFGAYWLGVPWLPMVLGSLVVAAFSVVGDLTESLLKRFAGVKDSGHLIPGHGGIMDRLDSITAAAPLLLLFALEFLQVAA
jgi:phosphatidate cytidylyltransferase